MPDKNTMNNPNRDMINTDAITQPIATETVRPIPPNYSDSGLLTYQFEFGDNGKIYSVFFEGKVNKEDIHGILEVLHSHLYEDCARIIRLYLERHHLEYSHFMADETTSDHAAIMGRAEGLLHSPCDKIDGHIGNADIYYAVADYQKWVHQNRCEGCYYAISRILNSGKHCYHIVAQTFAVGKYDNNPNGYFAIRTNKDNGQLCNIDTKNGEPVLPAFGCVDMMDILINIDSIRTAGQAEQTAVR